MKLALSTDFGAGPHWDRLIAFAKDHSVERLVFWGDFSTAGFTPPFLYPRSPGWLTPEERVQRGTIRANMASAAQRTRQAGMEFWYCFQVLMVPEASRLRRLAPELFNATGEPDMAADAVYALIEDQIDELLAIAPYLAGLELWIMECATILISNLAHQSIPLEAIGARVVATVEAKCRRHGLGLAVCLHTAGGDRAMREGLLAAARPYPAITVTADNVVGDFHLQLPFNQHLWRAAQTNPVQVCFDLNGEYWGRNFYPTCALRQYEAHLAEARRLGAAWGNGRISTGHDRWSPHGNVLPSRRRFYPASGDTAAGSPLRQDLEICCFDTLGGFNAEFFCQSVTHGVADRHATVSRFLESEFGPVPEDLVAVLLEVEGVAAGVFYAGQNYFNAQSVLPSPAQAHFWALDWQLTAPAGEAFIPHSLSRAGRAAFDGWPVATGLRTTGAQALIAEKRQALAEAETLLARAEHATESLAPDVRAFICGQFRDFVLVASAASVLLESMVHWFYWQAGTKSGNRPDRARLGALAAELSQIAQAWKATQPHDEWQVAARLSEWHELIATALSPLPGRRGHDQTISADHLPGASVGHAADS